MLCSALSRVPSVPHLSRAKACRASSTATQASGRSTVSREPTLFAKGQRADTTGCTPHLTWPPVRCTQGRRPQRGLIHVRIHPGWPGFWDTGLFVRAPGASSVLTWHRCPTPHVAQVLRLPQPSAAPALSKTSISTGWALPAGSDCLRLSRQQSVPRLCGSRSPVQRAPG